METDKALSQALGIEPVKQQKEIVPKQEISVPATGNDVEDDYSFSRKTFQDLINKGNMAIDELAQLASSTEHPRSYEVLATLIKTVSESTKDLYDIHKKTKDLKDTKSHTDINVDKAVFVGTTADLLKQVKNNEKF